MQRLTLLVLALALAISVQSVAAGGHKKPDGKMEFVKEIKCKICKTIEKTCQTKCGSDCCWGTSDHLGKHFGFECSETAALKHNISSYCCTAIGPVDGELVITCCSTGLNYSDPYCWTVAALSLRPDLNINP